MLSLVLTCVPPAYADQEAFSFGVIAQPMKSLQGDDVLRNAIEDSNKANLAFVVATSIKSGEEPCTDKEYLQKKDLLQSAKHGVVISVAGSDWADCKSGNGKSTSLVRLNQLRDLFFPDEFSLGGTRIPLVRQSTIARFQSFAENTRWEIGNIMFATLNVPRNNNNYVYDAGRNSEFEDRLVANREWLQRVFLYAERGQASGIVLFCDANPLAKPTSTGRGKRDGFMEMRRLILAQASGFPGKVLLIHNQPGKQGRIINWRGNLATLGIQPGWTMITAKSSSPQVFEVEAELRQVKRTQ